ncbi:fluoride efflux transporter FluC [Longivirga aurantiaca]|uniref:Fluoride-specific ion channel FluC n=1 Tax=Longivirga aurantiaca TaxID=1837743 RepID=A0ABW1SXV8_9ACTN
MTTATRTALARPDEVAAVALGGVLGALARYAVSVAVPHDDPAAWPWATFVVNLLGCLLLGILLDVVDARRSAWAVTQPSRARLARPFLASGVLGGFTTFSTFSLEAVRLAGEGRPATAAAYAGSSVVLGVLAVLVGRRMGAAVAGPAPVDLREDEDL